MWEPYYSTPHFNGYPFQQPNPYGAPYQTPMQQQPVQQMPIQQPPTSSQQMVFNGITTVDGLEGANSCYISPGSCVLLMDSKDNKFWIKSVDQFGATAFMQEYTFKEVASAPNNPSGYVSVAQFNELKKELDALKEQYERHTEETTGSKPETDTDTVVAVPIDDWE